MNRYFKSWVKAQDHCRVHIPSPNVLHSQKQGSVKKMKTLLRFVRTSVAAARHFSVEATAVVAATKPAAAEGRSGSPTTTSKGGRDTLGRRLLSLVYAKRSAVITIRKWKEEGHAVRKYELNRVVRELRKLRRYKHALEVLLL